MLEFSRRLFRGPDRHGRHGFRADREHRSRRVGRDCQAGRVWLDIGAIHALVTVQCLFY